MPRTPTNRAIPCLRLDRITPPSRTWKLTEAEKQASHLINATRAPTGHGFAALQTWRVLISLRLNPARATVLLALTRPEVS
jgi:hypothetical protein